MSRMISGHMQKRVKMIKTMVREIFDEYGSDWMQRQYKVSRQTVWFWKTEKKVPSAHTLIQIIHDYNDLIKNKTIYNHKKDDNI